MSTPDHYRRLAEIALRLAENSASPDVARSMQALAADYLEKAGELREQQQQQIQPKNRKVGHD
jgi:hypothetical protein